MYCHPNFRTKKALKEALASGQRVTVTENTPWGTRDVADGAVYLEGPHYPEPHKWYAQGVVKDGRLVSCK